MKSSTVSAVAALSIVHLASSQILSIASSSTVSSSPQTIAPSAASASATESQFSVTDSPGAVASAELGPYASYFSDSDAELTSIGEAVIAVVTSVDASPEYTTFLEEIYAAVPTSLQSSFISAFSTEDWDQITAEPWFTGVNPNAPAFETSVEYDINAAVDSVINDLGTPSALLSALKTPASKQSLSTYTYSSTQSTTAPPTTSSTGSAGAAGATSSTSTSTSKAGAAKMTGVAYAGAAALGLVGAMIAL